MPTLTPTEFALKWKGSTRTERAASQEHFIDLCHLVGVLTPNEADPTGETYAFEKGAEKTGGGDGFADVWRNGLFAWEYKGKRKDLGEAYQQLLQYREALDNPPLLVVCDLDRFEVHTNFTNTAKRIYRFDLDELATAPRESLRILRAVMQEPSVLRPGETREELTERAAGDFADLAQVLRERGHDPQQVAHFLNKLLFCMFAEDAGLLPAALLRRVIEGAQPNPAELTAALSELFGQMARGGRFGAEAIQWFNGGLFDGPDVLPLESRESEIIRRVSLLDWSQVEPAIFGTLFERGLDPGKRSQLGAHYTDRSSIERVLEPVVVAPLRREFAAMQAEIQAMPERQRMAVRTRDQRVRRRDGSERVEKRGSIITSSPAYQRYRAFLDRLYGVRVLDPACGSGNFLYMALQALKDLEKEVNFWAASTLGVPLAYPQISPEALSGIELSPYAAELARVSIWIGEIQWMLQNGFNYLRDPILRPLDNIECRDAVLDFEDGSPREAHWPDAEFIIGNPPFLGVRKMRAGLGGDYLAALFRVFQDRVPHEADYVCYWFEKARAMVEPRQARRVGLLATQSIRAGMSRHVLDEVKRTGDIFAAWDDEPWVVEGAAVRVSIIGFDDGTDAVHILDGKPVPSINANLTAGTDVTHARRLPANRGIAFQGSTKGGPFEIPSRLAQEMLTTSNPDRRSNADVLRPWVNGNDITTRPRGLWIIDFGTNMPEEQAALYEAPFEYVRRHVEPARRSNNRAAYAERWWLHVEPRSGLRTALAGLSRFIATPRVSKHRVYIWLPVSTLPDSRVIAFARDDDYFFGLLHSHAHELWSMATGSQHGVGATLTYTPGATFETFPFPQPTEEQREMVAAAARSLDALRGGWLDPPGADPNELENRTLTNLYNERPTWLNQTHARLDRVIHAAYGWPYPLNDYELVARLLELNLARAS